jgi:hypothetical protein
VLSENTLLALTTPVDTVRLEEQLVKGRDTPVVAFKILAVARVTTDSTASNDHAMAPAGAHEERETS